MRVPHPLPYQGSKRNLAHFILRFFPPYAPRLIEPFAGSAAVSIAAAIHRKASSFVLNDINGPLMDLWDQIINDPEGISEAYKKLWNEQLGHEKEFYLQVRHEFNESHRPDCFLYLLARCVKASIRYNSDGEFNQSADNRRKGRRPEAMRADILAVSRLLKDRTLTSSKDYREILQDVSPNDLVYMDPPYQGVCGNRDPRYSEAVQFDTFVAQLETLVSRQISFIVSYDGRRGYQIYGKQLPENIGVSRLEVRAGRSTQSTLLGRSDTTYESLYLSKPLLERLGLEPNELDANQTVSQLELDLGAYKSA